MPEVQDSSAIQTVSKPPPKEVPLADNLFLAVVQGIENTAQSLRESHPADAHLLRASSERIRQEIVGWITKGQGIILQSESATHTLSSEELAQMITGNRDGRMAALVFHWNKGTSTLNGIPNEMLTYDAQDAVLASFSPTVPRRHLPIASSDLLDEWNRSEESFNQSPGRLERFPSNIQKATLRTSIPGVTYEVYERPIPSGGLQSLDHIIVFNPDTAVEAIRSMNPDQVAQLSTPQTT